MLDLMERAKPGALDRLRVDAIAELSAWRDVQVQLVPEVSSSVDGCSVAGSYEDELVPPALRVAESASPRRRQFTALHECGHHLQRTDLDLGKTVIGAEGDRFEDDACDLFAARVLLPDSLADGCFGERTPTPGDIVELYRASSASRAACVVRAVERLVGFGVVVLYDGTGVVSFAAAKGSIFPPARGSDQSSTALVTAALREPTRPDGVPFTCDRTTIRYRSGHNSDPLYGQAAWCDGYLIAVLVDSHAPWQPFSLPRRGIQVRQPKWADCEVCSTDFEVTDTCSTCDEPCCPSGHCACTQQRERRCQRCNLTWALHRFPDGGVICADCL
jgi:hypothetical protein